MIVSHDCVYISLENDYYACSFAYVCSCDTSPQVLFFTISMSVALSFCLLPSVQAFSVLFSSCNVYWFFSMVVKGVVCKKNVAHRRMTSRIEKPRILILGGALEYQRVSNLLSSFDTLLQQVADLFLFLLFPCVDLFNFLTTLFNVYVNMDIHSLPFSHVLLSLCLGNGSSKDGGGKDRCTPA